jgi:hypothetical protein
MTATPLSMHSSQLASVPVSVFERVNAFLGRHVDCTDIGEDVSYDVGPTIESLEHIVTVRCVCGAEASFPVRLDDAHALLNAARSFGISTTSHSLTARV